MPLFRRALIILILTALTACTLPSQATPWSPPTAPATAIPATATLSPTPLPSATMAATATVLPITATPTFLPPAFIPPDQPRTQYHLEATLDYTGHSVAVSEQITYTNTTTGSLTDLPLVVEARRYPNVFDLESLAWADGNRISQFYWTDTRLTVMLPQPLAVGEALSMRLAYTLYLFDSSKQPNTQAYPLGYTPDQINIGDWYPYIPPFIPQLGWQIHKPWYYGEHLVYDSSDFEVAIRMAGTGTDLVIAASAPAQSDGEWQRYRHSAARSFAWSASPFYQVITQTVTIPGYAPVVAASYFLPMYAKAGKSLSETMARALSVYSELFGAYPHPLLSSVQAEFLDGMEYDGLFFLGSNFYDWYTEDPAQFLTMLGAHETAHQWWYGIVGSDPALEPWLDEALCTYSERLYYEKIAPQALQWWWDYRIHYYSPDGWIDMSIYDVPNNAGHYRAYRDTVYFNGALYLEDLRTLVGEEAFFAALKDYAQTFAYTQATATDFFNTVRLHSSANLAPLLRKYFKSRQ